MCLSLMDCVTATYRLRCSAAEAEALARHIALEQTVEVPEELIDSPRIRDEILGRVRSVTACPDTADRFLAVIDYPAEVAGTHVGQMWNLLFGNISLKRCVRLLDATLPAAVAGQLPGPRFGVAGVRELIGVHGRPLLATALKPRGSSDEHLASLAAAFAQGGGDVVKDDHNLVDPSFEAFKQRVTTAHEAVERINQQTGRRTLYAPNLSPPMHELERSAEFLVQHGFRAALIAPMLLGLETVRRLTAQFPLVWLGHPTFTGCFFHDPDHGVAPELLLGKWFRWIGCDATIFPNHGGRFSFSPNECRAIAQAALDPSLPGAPCWPAPAGGMSFTRLQEMAADYGADSQFLIGGALLSDSVNLVDSTRRFRDAIGELFPAATETAPAATFVSACELPAAAQRVLEQLRFRPDFQWEGRSPTVYKMNGALPFRDVARTELIGPHGEQTAFDLRYFEIAPGGYSSREKHVHTHVVIGVRGQGRLESGEDTLAIDPFDIAYVPPLRVHQLHNDGSTPFGFLCIVDHERDKPQAP